MPALGLTLLHTLMEELVTGAKQRVITAQRRRQLCEQLATNLPVVLNVLVPILQAGLSNRSFTLCAQALRLGILLVEVVPKPRSVGGGIAAADAFLQPQLTGLLLQL